MKNADITSFFKQIPKSSQSVEAVDQTQPPKQGSQNPQPTGPSSSRSLSPRPLSARSHTSRAQSPDGSDSSTRSPPLSSSPYRPLSANSTPKPESPRLQSRARDAVIPGSDDEDSDISSDEDLPDLLESIRRPAPTPPKRDSNACLTPRAKRVATAEFLSSPLTINTKGKRSTNYGPLNLPPPDFAMLTKNTSTYLSDPDLSSSPSMSGSPQIERATLFDAIPTGQGSEEEGKHLKILRAVQRTEATSSHRKWSFFEKRDGENAGTVKRPFPRQSANRIWDFLSPAKTRPCYFQNGMVHDIQLKTGTLPDEIFLWVLNEIPFEDSDALRSAYIKLVGACPKHVYRLLNEHAIGSLFTSIGASKEAVCTKAKTDCSTKSACPVERQLIGLDSILHLISAASKFMEAEALNKAILLLLRLGNDSEVQKHFTIRHSLGNVLHELVQAIPFPSNQWTVMCENVCTLLCQTIDNAVFRSNVLLMIPTTSPGLLDLRRRLALVFLFDDPQRGGSDPGALFSMLSIHERLEAPDFVIDHRTDYQELTAMVSILDMAIDSGSPPVGLDSPEAADNFDHELDELARSIKHMYSIINTGQFVTRHEARSALENLERRLHYVVRTKPPFRGNLFSTGLSSVNDDRPKQQEFMRSYFKKATT